MKAGSPVNLMIFMELSVVVQREYRSGERTHCAGVCREAWSEGTGSQSPQLSSVPCMQTVDGQGASL